MIEYSSASYTDIEPVAELFLEVYSGLLKKLFKKLPSVNLVKDVLYVYLDTAKKGFIVAKDHGEIVGFVCGVKSVMGLWRCALHPKRILKFLFTPRQIFIMPPSLGHFFHGGHVPLMGVAKKYRMKGIGLKLSDKVLDFLKKEDVKAAYFQIPNSLVDTYVKHGCDVLKKRKKWSVMRKRL